MASIAGSVAVQVNPDARGFGRKTEAELSKQRVKFDVPVNPNLKRLTAELAAERKRQEANAINLKVKVDQASLRRAANDVRRIEQTFKASALSKAIRVNVIVAGAAALPALTQGVFSLTTALTNLAGAAAVVPGLISGIGAAVGTAVIGVNGLSDAFRAAGSATKDAAQNAREYHRATRQLENAQRDVVDALKKANREIQDQKDKLTSGQLSVEQARLNVAKANERLLEGGFKRWTDWQQAVLDQKQAQFDLGQAIKENTRNVQDYYDNASKGATGTNTFRDALDRLSTATENFTKKQNEVNGITDEFLYAMSRLSQGGRDFVNQILSLKSAWQGFQGAVQDKFLAGLGDEIVNLANNRLPLLKRGMEQVAQGLNADIKSALRSIGSDQNANAIASILERTGNALTRMQPGINSLVTAFLRLSEVGSRFFPRLADAFNSVMGRFEAFVNRADKDGSLQKWIDRGLDSLASLGRSLGHIFGIFGSITKAYETATGNFGGFTTTLEGWLGKLDNYLKGGKGQRALVGYIQEAKEFMATLKESLPGIGDAFQAIGDAAREFAKWWWPIFSAIGKFMAEHGRMVALILGVYASLKTLGPVIGGLRKMWAHATDGARAYRNTVKLAADAHAQANELLAKQKTHLADVQAAHQKVLETQKRENAQAQARLAAARDVLATRQDELRTAKQIATENAQARVRDARAGLSNARAEEHGALQTSSANNLAANQRVLSARGEVAGAQANLAQAKAAHAAGVAAGTAHAMRVVELNNAIDAGRGNTAAKHMLPLIQERDALVARGSGVDMATLTRNVAAAEEDLRNKVNAVRDAEANKAKVASQGAETVARAQDKVKAKYSDVNKAVQQSTTAAKNSSREVVQAQQNVVKAQGDVADAVRHVATTTSDASNTVKLSQQNVATAMGQVNDAQKLVTQGANNLAGASTGFGKLKTVIGTNFTRGGAGLLGALGGLWSAFGAVSGVVGIGVGLGLTYAINQLAEAHGRAADAADRQRRMEDQLKNTLQKGTGAATNATLEENIKSLQGAGGGKVDATKVLEGQGIPIQRQANLALPTQIQQREQEFKRFDDQLTAAVPNMIEWQKFGDKLKKYGVDERVYAQYLNGEEGATRKFFEARQKIHDDNNFGLPSSLQTPVGFEVADGSLPHEAGQIREQLPKNLQDLSVSVGHLRGLGDAGLAAGQQTQRQGQSIPQRALNQRGADIFGRLGIAPNGVSIQGDGSANIAVDRDPSDIPGWLENGFNDGIQVESGPNGSATITIDKEHVDKFFLKRAGGGPVWGAGSATSDSIPAMLSNGEFVMSAKAVQHWGIDSMHALNGAQGFDEGGLVKPPILTGPLGPQSPPGPISRGALDAIHGTSPAPLAPQFPVNSAPVSPTLTPSTPAGVNPLLDAARASVGSGYLEPPVPRIPATDVTPDVSTSYKAAYTKAPTLTPPTSLAGVAIPPVTGPAPHTPSQGLPGPKGFTVDGVQAPTATSTPTTSAPTPATPAASVVPSYEQLGPPGTSIAASVASPSGPIALDLSGSGALPDSKSSAASAAKGAPINPNANILAYLRDTALSRGLRVGAGSSNAELDAKLGLGVHSDDGMQHSFNRALDIGSSEEAKAGKVSAFVKEWMSDPAKVASTRQLIFRGPDGDYGIINGRVLQGSELQAVYGSALPEHGDHVHLALEGVPADVLGAEGQPLAIGGGNGGGSGGLSSSIPGLPAIPGITAPIQGPFGPIPFNGIDFAKQLGEIFLTLVGGFFGIDLSPIIGIANKITGGLQGVGGFGGGNAGSDALPGDPGPDQNIVNQLIQQAQEAKANGDEPLARQLLATAQQYAGRGTVPTPSSSGGSAPSAAYSGGSDATHAAVYRAFKEAGFDDSEWPALVQLLNHENDTWDPTRPTSGPNSDASGIFQFLSSTWASVGMTPSTDPYIQGVAGMRYIKQRYGTPSAAWAFWQNPSDKSVSGGHWYSAGGPVSGPGGPRDDSIPAMLSNGEFVVNAKSAKRIGMGRLAAMNKAPHLADGGIVGGLDFLKPLGVDLSSNPGGQANGPLPGPEPAPPAEPAPPNPDDVANPNGDPAGIAGQVAQGIGNAGGAIADALAPKGAEAGWGGGPDSAQPQGGEDAKAGGRGGPDPRSTLAPAPASDDHLNPALKGGIEGAFNAVGAIAGQVVGMAVNAGIGAAGAPGAGGPAAGQASQAASAGFQIAGQAASGVANVISSLLVGTVSGSSTGQGYGAPLLPAPAPAPLQPQQPAMVINGGVHTQNLDEWSQMQDRKQAQAAAPFYNRPAP